MGHKELRGTGKEAIRTVHFIFQRRQERQSRSTECSPTPSGPLPNVQLASTMCLTSDPRTPMRSCKGSTPAAHTCGLSTWGLTQEALEAGVQEFETIMNNITKPSHGPDLYPTLTAWLCTSGSKLCCTLRIIAATQVSNSAAVGPHSTFQVSKGHEEATWPPQSGLRFDSGAITHFHLFPPLRYH